MKRCALSSKITLPAATLGALAASSAASASILYSREIESSISGGQTIYFDLDQDGPALTSNSFSGTEDFSISFADTAGEKPSIDSAQGNRWVAHDSSSSYAGCFAPNDSIGPALGGRWYSGAWINYYGGNPAWASGTTGYLALSIGSAGSYNYGWAHITYEADNRITLHSFAYETTANTAIQAGAIPEPSTYAALTGLLAGSAVLYSRRRKRAA